MAKQLVWIQNTASSLRCLSHLSSRLGVSCAIEGCFGSFFIDQVVHGTYPTYLYRGEIVYFIYFVPAGHPSSFAFFRQFFLKSFI